jgi:hypothetical protein
VRRLRWCLLPATQPRDAGEGGQARTDKGQGAGFGDATDEVVGDRLRKCQARLPSSSTLAARTFFVVLVVAVLAAPPARAEVSDQERLRRAVDYLLASQLPSGFFRYDLDFLADRPAEGDNIVRQVGAGYILAEYYLHARERRVLLAVEAVLEASRARSLPIGKSWMQSALERSGLFALPVGRYKLRAGLERMHLLYLPTGNGKVISQDGRYQTALLGATAVGALAELQFYEATADKRFGDLRAAWVRGLMSLWVPGRGFRVAPDLIDQSSFFDGEAWFALAYYLDLFPRDEAVASLVRSLEPYLMARYASEVSTGFYQWGTMAAARRLRTTADPRYVAFIRQQAQAFLDAPRQDEWRGYNSCAEIEGLATAARVLREGKGGDAALLERIRVRVREEMDKNRGLQIPPNATRLAFAEGVYISSPRLRDFAGAFLSGRYQPSTRIDDTLHCVSALIKLAQ